MKPRRSNPLSARFFHSHVMSTVMVISMTALAIDPSAQAANRYWDGGTVNIATTGDGASGGTAGNWDTTLTNWDQGSGLAHVAWSNAAQDTALFAGTSGTVTLTAPVTAAALTFTAAGYTVAGTSPNILTLGGTSATITTSTLATSGTTTISSPIAGTLTSGLTIASNGDMSATGGGAGGLGVKLSGVNTFTGNITVTSGLLSYAADSALGNAANTITLNGGGLLDANSSLTINRNVSIGASGGIFRLYGSSTGTLNGILSGSGAFSRTDGGTLILAGNNTYSGTFTSANGGNLIVTGTNAAATYNINAGSIQIGNNGSTGSLNAGSSVNIGASGAMYVRRTDSVSATSILPSTINFSAAGSRFEYNPNSSSAALNLNQDMGALVSGVASTGLFRVSGGTLTLASGTDVVADTMSLGLLSATNLGTLNIGPGSTFTTRWVNIGADGNNSGIVNQSGGTVTVQTGGNGFRLGHWSNGTNPGSAYNLSGGTLDTTAVLSTISWDGAATFNLSGGTWKAGAINFDGGGVDTALGTLNITSTGVLEVGGNIGASSTSAEGVFLGGGTLKATGAVTVNSNLAANASTTSVLDTNGNVVTLAGNITGTGTINVQSLPIGNTVKFSTTVTQTVNPVITGATELQKVGTGTTTLTAVSSHSGDFFVDAGRLNLAAGSSIASNIEVTGTATTIGGEGTSTNSVLFNSGTRIAVDPATTSALTVKDLDISGQPSVVFESQPSPSQSPIKILTYTGTLTSPNGIAADLLIPGAGNYRTPVINDAAGVVTVTLGSAATTWNGTGGGEWDVKTSTRWGDGTGVFAWGDAVTFDDSGVTTGITITGELQPSSIVVNSSTNNYTITGSTGNFISGTTGLLKSGTSTLTMNGPNTFTGGTVISQGTIQIRSAGALGTGTVTLNDTNTGANNTALYIDAGRVNFVAPVFVSNNGTGTSTIGTRVSVTGSGPSNGFNGITLARDLILDSNATDRTDYQNISGTGNITITGAGRTVFTTTNTFTGNLTISPSGTGGTFQNGVATAASTNYIPDASNVTVTDFPGAGQAEFRLSSQAETINALNGNGTIDTNSINTVLTVGGAGGSGTFTGTIQNGGANTVGLTKTGAGTQTLSGPNNYTGVTTISGGILQFTTQTSLYNNTLASWTPANIKVASGGTVAFGVGGTGEFTGSDITTLLFNLKTITSNGLQAGSAVGFNTTNASGGTFTIPDIISNSTGTGSGAVGVAKLGTGTLVLNGANTYTGPTNVLDGTLKVNATSGNKSYTVSAAGTLEINHTSANSFITVNGSGTAATTGIYFKAGVTHANGNTLTLQTAPTTVRAVGSGVATLSGWDTNATHLTVAASASGSVYDSTINIWPSTYGYVLNIAAGANTATGDMTIQGLFTGNVTTNGCNYRKTNTGSLVITGQSSAQTTPWQVQNGSLVLSGGANRIGTGAGVTLGSDSTSGKLVLNGNDQTLANIASAGTGISNAIVNGSTTPATLTVSSSSAVTFPSASTTATIGGAGTNENNLTLAKSGTGTLNLGGTNTHTGGTKVNGGILSLASVGALGTTGTITMNGGTLQFTAANTTDYTATGRLKLEDVLISSFDTNGQNITFSAPLAVGTLGTGGLAKTGAGSLTISGNQAYTGATSVNAGTLTLDYSSANGSKLSDSAALTLAGGTLNLAGGSHSELVSNTDVTGISTISRTSGTATINLGNITRTGSNTLNILGDNIARTSMSNDISGKLPSWITVNGSPAANDGAGNIIAFSGFYNVNRLGGLIPNNPANNVRIVNGGTSGDITTVASGVTDISTLLQNANAGPAVVSLGGGDILRLGAIGAIQVPATSGALTIQYGTLTAGGADDTNGEIAVDAASNLTIASPILNNGTGVVSLSKAGVGKLILAEANDLTGGITLNAGELDINNPLAMGLTGTFTINGGTIDNTSGLEVSIGDTIPQAWNADINFPGTDNLLFGPGLVTLGGNRTVNVANNTLGVGGTISGAYTLTKTGAGAFSVATKSWSGLTTVSGGTLEVKAKAPAHPDTPYVVASGATLKVGYSTDGGYAATNLKVTGNGVAATTGFYLSGGKTYNVSGSLELLGAPTTIRQYGSGPAKLGQFDINSGTFLVTAAASGSQTDANVNFVSSGYGMTIQTDAGANTATGDFILNGSLDVDHTGNGFYKRGGGSLRLNGAATTNNRNIRLHGGTIICGIAQALGSSSRLDLASGTKLVLNGYNQTTSSLLANSGRVVGGSSTASVLTVNQAENAVFAGTLGGTGTNENNFSLVKTGSSKLTLSAANTYSGNTSVNAGTLSLGTAYLADGSDVLITTGATLELTTATTDTIDELILDGTPQAAGVYGAIGSGAQFERSYITGTGTLTVTTGPAGYTGWETANGITGAGAATDSDGDGIPNGIEFVIGGDPSGPDSNSSALLPTITVDGTYLNFVFRRTADSVAYDPFVEYGSTLAGWTPAEAGVNGVIVNEDAEFFGTGIDRVTVRIPRSLAVDSKLFGRLHVDITP